MKTLNTASKQDRDPTKQGGNRKRLMTNINRRLRGAYRDVMIEYKNIPKKLISNRRTYEYLTDDFRQKTLDERIREIINDWFGTGETSKPASFFTDSFVSQAYAVGTNDSMDRIRLLASQHGEFDNFTIEQLDFEKVFQTPIYRRRVEIVHTRLFNEMVGFTGTTATELSRVLSDVVASGASPRVAQQQIAKRFDVAKSRAERIARTEINRAYTISRTENAEDVSKRLNIDVRVIHRSSLMAATRFTHGRRHGETYTTQEQNDWWATGSNRINCLCSIIEVVMGSDGKPIGSSIIKKLKKQKESWFPTA